MRIAVLILLLACTGCERAKQGAKDVLNTSGEVAGKAASEVLEGVTTGVEKTWDVQVILDSTLRAQGLTMGRWTVAADNRLSIYLVAGPAFNDTLTAYATDKDGLEIGRARVPVVLATDAADYFELTFQDRTDLKRKSVVVLR